MITYSAPLIFSGIAWWIMHSSDKVMIEALVCSSALGLYTAATKIPSLINVITAIFNQAWSISSIKETETTHDDKFYSNTFNYNCFIIFSAGVITISFVKPLMGVYVGIDFKESWIYTPFLLVSAIYYSIFAFCGTMYAALQKSINDMVTSVLAAIMNIIINYIFILKVGVWGAIIGTVASFVIFSLTRIIDIRRYILFEIDLYTFIINSIITFVLALSITLGINPFFIAPIVILVFLFVNFKYIKVLTNFSTVKKKS